MSESARRQHAPRLCACGCGQRPRNFYAQYIAGHKPPTPIAERLWTRVQEVDDCWLWMGSCGADGYGRIGAEGARTSVLTHRVAYELLVGPIPDGLVLDHLCRTRRCVRPDHLDPVPNRLNIQRGESNSVVTVRTDTCQRGHAFTENAYVNPSGRYRACRICANEKQRQRRAARRAA